jgi:hypothetical protein
MLQGWNNRGFHFQLVERNTTPGRLSKSFLKENEIYQACRAAGRW